MFRVIGRGFKWKLSKAERSVKALPEWHPWAPAKWWLCVIKMNKVYDDVPSLQFQHLLSPPLFNCFVHLKLVLKKNNRNRSWTYSCRAVFLVAHHSVEEARRLQSLIMNWEGGIGEKRDTGVGVRRVPGRCQGVGCFLLNCNQNQPPAPGSGGLTDWEMRRCSSFKCH